jgi:hypothetical protein
MVLRRGARHRRTADVDGLDLRTLLERVEVRHDEFERQDAVQVEVVPVLVVTEVGEQTAVNLRVQCLHPAVEHLRRAGHLLHTGDGNARSFERG